MNSNKPKQPNENRQPVDHLPMYPARYHCSVSSISQVRNAVAEMLQEAQDAGMLETANSDDLDQALCNLLWDETKMKVLMQGRGIQVRSILTTSGTLLWFTLAGEQRLEEIVSPPAAIEDTSANSMLNALRVQVPQLMRVLNSSKMGALLLTLDAAKTNTRLVNHLLQP